MDRHASEGGTESVTVRVTTAGNSKALPVPAAFARRHHAEPGTQWKLREAGAALVYEPADTTGWQPVSYGEGRDRVTVIPADALSSAAGSTDPDCTFDWSF